jgi:hypothetical protein
VVAPDATLPEELRTGVGPAVAADHLPVSWAADRLALRLTAEGTETDPARV